MNRIIIPVLVLLFFITCLDGKPQEIHGSTLVNAEGGVVYTMDFESVQDFSLNFPPWSVTDADDDSTYGVENHTFPHNLAPTAFIAFNPAQVVPAMTDPGILPHGGSRFGACFSSPKGANDDWFISPKIKLKYNGEFSCWVKSYTTQYGSEKYRIGVSTTSNDPSAFSFISGTLPLTADTLWTKKSFSLSTYNNQEVYVAVQCVSDNAFIFMIDDLEVNPGDSILQLPSSVSLDFENIPDFSLDFSPWSVKDVNGGWTYGITSGGDTVSFPNSRSPMAYICFNEAETTPPLVNMPAHSGNKFGACFSSEPPHNPNNKWLISPRMKLEANARLVMWVQTHNSVYGYEKYNICVSTGGNDPADFAVISGSKPDSAPIDWTRKVYDLTTYANESVYIGIQCVTNNGFIFMVDDIEIGSHVAINDLSQDETIRVFPNPAKDKVFIDPGGQFSGTMKIILSDGTGRVVKAFNSQSVNGLFEVNLPDVEQGVYLLNLETREKVIVKKIIIQK